MLTFKWCNSIQVHPRWHSVQPSVHVRREGNGNQLFACYNNGEAQGLVLLKKFGARKDRKDVSGFRRWETWVVGSKWFSSTSVISQEQLTMLEHVLKTHRPSVIGQPHLPPKLFFWLLRPEEHSLNNFAAHCVVTMGGQVFGARAPTPTLPLISQRCFKDGHPSLDAMVAKHFSRCLSIRGGASKSRSLHQQPPSTSLTGSLTLPCMRLFAEFRSNLMIFNVYVPPL